MIKTYIAGTCANAAESVKGMFSRIRSNRRLCWFIGLMGKYLLCGLVLLAWTIAAERYGQKQALETYRGWLEDYKIEQEAAAQEAIETDPYTIQLKNEAKLMATAVAGVSGYNYGKEDIEHIVQCAWNRYLNPGYPDTIENVLLEPGAFDFYSQSNKPTVDEYEICYNYLDMLHKSEFLICETKFVFLELGEHVVLRDTLNKTNRTDYWRGK